MNEHLCHARGCKTPVPPKLFMCKPHWSKLPQFMQDLIWEHYVPGQEVTKTPTGAYLRIALDAVQLLEDQEPNVLFEDVNYG